MLQLGIPTQKTLSPKQNVSRGQTRPESFLNSRKLNCCKSHSYYPSAHCRKPLHWERQRCPPPGGSRLADKEPVPRLPHRNTPLAPQQSAEPTSANTPQVAPVRNGTFPNYRISTAQCHEIRRIRSIRSSFQANRTRELIVANES